jgi:hypothetical protein
MKNMLYGALCGAVVFAALTWATTKMTVHAAVQTAPPQGRFQLVQLHPNTDTEWSGILDTETGCTWLFESSNPDDPKITNQAYKYYLQALGAHSFGLLNFDPGEYMVPKMNEDKTVDYTPQLAEIIRVQKACSQARLQALAAAGAR